MEKEQNTPEYREDPLLDEIRRVKESVSLQFDHDVVKLCRELRREQEASGKRLIRRRKATPRPSSPAVPDGR
ncbi:MAG: hypothetical protein JXA90_12610 [Planctomycetes bacterium]|nr:hypothetical protein [Planctomycetota bacterium]